MTGLCIHLPPPPTGTPPSRRRRIEDRTDYHLAQNRTGMNMSSITLPTELYIARSQQLIVSYHFLQWKLSFPGEGTAVPFNGNDRSF